MQPRIHIHTSYTHTTHCQNADDHNNSQNEVLTVSLLKVLVFKKIKAKKNKATYFI